jgi:hypothetical protein
MTRHQNNFARQTPPAPSRMTTTQAAKATLSFTTPDRLAGGILFHPTTHNLMANKNADEIASHN